MTALAATSTRSTRWSLASPIRRHPLKAYFALAFAGTWITQLPIVLSQNGLGVLPFPLPDLVFFVLFIVAAYAGPTLAALTVTAATDGRAGLRRFLRRYVQWRVGLGWTLLVLFGYPFVLLAGASLAIGAAPLEALVRNWPLLFTSYLSGLFTFQLIASLAEEPGWRGFALPRLQARYGALLGSVILGALHALWHLPVFLIPAIGLGPLSLPFLAGWIPVVLATAVLWTWVYNNTKGSILIAILLHAAQNAAQGYAGKILGGLSLEPAAAARADLTMFAGVVIGALLVIALTKGRLSYRMP